MFLIATKDDPLYQTWHHKRGKLSTFRFTVEHATDWATEYWLNCCQHLYLDLAPKILHMRSSIIYGCSQKQGDVVPENKGEPHPSLSLNQPLLYETYGIDQNYFNRNAFWDRYGWFGAPFLRGRFIAKPTSSIWDLWDWPELL